MAVNFVNIQFSILIGRFLLLNPLLNAGGRHQVCGILKASILSSVVLRKHGIFSVSNIRSLDFIDDLLDVWYRWVAKCESFSIPLFILQSVLSYFPLLFISISLIDNSWCIELITCGYDKTKNVHWTNMIFKGTSVLASICMNFPYSR